MGWKQLSLEIVYILEPGLLFTNYMYIVDENII